jgi:hypothetical protein
VNGKKRKVSHLSSPFVSSDSLPSTLPPPPPLPLPRFISSRLFTAVGGSARRAAAVSLSFFSTAISTHFVPYISPHPQPFARLPYPMSTYGEERSLLSRAEESAREKKGRRKASPRWCVFFFLSSSSCKPS